MKKRIYLNFLCLIFLAVLLLSASLCLYYYNLFKEREIASVKSSAALIENFMFQDGNENPSYSIGADSLRVTIIEPDGTVLFDNQAAAGNLGNHSDRVEVESAIQTGTGEAIRYSDTLLAETYYYAVRLSDGNILRLAKTIGSIVGVFSASLPAVLIVTALILFLAIFLARRLTAKIIKPLESIDFEDGNAAVYDELSPYARKIAEQKREIMEQITAQKNRADTILAITENMKESLILIDHHGLVLAANKTAAALFGEMAQKSILHVCRDIEFGQGVKRCLAGEMAEKVIELAGRTYGVYFSPVQGEPRGAVLLFIDKTEQYEAEKQRREFSANVSHELKTPLTSISALSEMIGNGMAKEEDVKGFAARIAEQAGRLISIIDDIIKLSEFDEDKRDAGRETFDLYALCESVVNALRENSKGVAIHITGQRLEVSANRRMIDELLYNLVDNGVKYNKDGGKVTVALSRTDGFCKIAVSDTGIGISKEHQSHVFERFYRADKSRSKKTGGTGLGLSIVKHITEYHDGKIELDSAENVGTTVTCWLADGFSRNKDKRESIKNGFSLGETDIKTDD